MLRGVASTTLSLDLGQCAMSISASPDRTRVVAGGRDVLKLLSFRADSQLVEEERNLRVGRQNMSLSCVDVVWHPLEANANELATAASNGHVVLWDLAAPVDNKLKHIIKAHTRTATCVAYHPSEVASLFSGSQDETVKRWDTRALAAVATDFAIKECVRSLRCNPHNPHQFAVALEGGTIQVWDARQPLVCELKIQAHQGPVYTVAWHPTRRNCLASGGRDKVIRVWDTGVRDAPGRESRDSLRASIQTIASVARVLWRPGHPDHLSSCSLVHDRQIHVWDLRREFIPVLSFEEHSNVTTDLLWDADGTNVLVSVGKDNCAIRHAVSDARRPAMDADLHAFGLSWGLGDDVVHFSTPRVSAPVQSPDRPATTPGLRQFFAPRVPRPQFDRVFESALCVQTLEPGPTQSHKVFVHLAKQYKLAASNASDSAGSLAHVNAGVADEAGAVELAQTWRVLAELWLSIQVPPAPQKDIVDDNMLLAADVHGYKFSLFDAPVDILEASQSGDVGAVSGLPAGLPAVQGRVLTGGPSAVTPPASVLRREVVAHRAAVDSDGGSDTGSMDDSHDDADAAFERLNVSDAPRYPALASLASGDHAVARVLTVSADATRPAPFDFSSVLFDILQVYGNNGDPQTCVALLLVFGERFFSGVSVAMQLPWFFAYCDLLERSQLWNQRTTVIRLAKIAEINDLNTDSTSVYTGCGGCHKPLLGRAAWRCAEKCKDVAGEKQGIALDGFVFYVASQCEDFTCGARVVGTAGTLIT